MDGKRPSKNNTDNKESKRAKTDFPLDIELDGIKYVNLTRLLKTTPFASYHAKHYKASEKRFIEKEAIEVFNVSKQNVSNGVFAGKPEFSPAHDLRLVKKDGKINDFIERVQSASHPMVPPILLDDDLAFTDALGAKHEVEMRGEPTEEGIYFKVKDIGQMFEIKNLANDIQHKNTQLEEGDNYVWFTIPENERKKHGASRELFFTHSGMLAAVFISKSSVAKQFRKWVSQIVFVHHLGNTEQKQDLARSLLDKKMIDELTKRCGYDIACVYLLETTKEPGDVKKVYKFGYTKNLQERMSKLIREHGRDSVIDTLLLLPEARLSSVEAEMKQVLGDTYRYEEGAHTELLALSEDECKAVRVTMRSIGKSFYGSTLVHQHQVDMIKKDHELQLVTATKDLQLALERARTEAKLANKDIEILEIKNHVQARRIQELEEMLRRVSKAP